jgi:hypothetical protein
LIRLNTGEVGVYATKLLGSKNLHTGIKIKGELPEPEEVTEDPAETAFIFEVIREQIKLIPRIWLQKSIRALIRDDTIDFPDTFKQWVLLSPKKKEDSELISLLEKATAYEGLKGLARYNDHAAN